MNKKKKIKDTPIADLPEPDKDGNLPAVPYARASIARDIIQDRVKLGLSQKDLADKSGIRVETLCRIENAKHTASVSTIEKIDRALKAAEKAQASRRQRQKRKAG
jgi:predicted transcriptional regulator